MHHDTRARLSALAQLVLEELRREPALPLQPADLGSLVGLTEIETLARLKLLARYRLAIEYPATKQWAVTDAGRSYIVDMRGLRGEIAALRAARQTVADEEAGQPGRVPISRDQWSRIVQALSYPPEIADTDPPVAVIFGFEGAVVLLLETREMAQQVWQSF